MSEKTYLNPKAVKEFKSFASIIEGVLVEKNAEFENVDLQYLQFDVYPPKPEDKQLLIKFFSDSDKYVLHKEVYGTFNRITLDELLTRLELTERAFELNQEENDKLLEELRQLGFTVTLSEVGKGGEYTATITTTPRKPLRIQYNVKDSLFEKPDLYQISFGEVVLTFGEPKNDEDEKENADDKKETIIDIAKFFNLRHLGHVLDV